MRENYRRLIDEASEFEPVKNTFRLGWEFIRLNQIFTVTVLGLIILISFFGIIPQLSLVATMLAGVLSMTLQIYAGRAVYTSKDITSYVELIKKSRIDTPEIKEHFSTAFGAYMGWITVLFFFIFMVSMIANSMGLIHENMNEDEIRMAYASISSPLIVVALVLSYVQPLVHSNIVLSNGFSEGFKAVFTLFSRDVWSSSMKKSYFIYVSIFGLVIMGVAVPFITLFMGMFFNIILLIGFYMLMIIMSISAMLARRVVEVQSDIR